MDWASNGFGRFYEGLPKHKIPNWVIGIGGAEVPKPEAILNFLLLLLHLKHFSQPIQLIRLLLKN